MTDVKATEEDLATLHGAIARGLTDIITEGVSIVVGKGEDATVEKTAAPASYFMAAITLLKNNNITADASKNKDLTDLTESLQRRRQASKGKMSPATLDAAAEALERDLGGLGMLN